MSAITWWDLTLICFPPPRRDFRRGTRNILLQRFSGSNRPIPLPTLPPIVGQCPLYCYFATERFQQILYFLSLVENLSIWSIPYGTLQGHVTLSTAKESTNKDSGRRHLVYLHKYLISATPDSLTCHFCRCDNGTLAQALGKLSTVQVDDNDQRENLTINWSTDDKVTMSYRKGFFLGGGGNGCLYMISVWFQCQHFLTFCGEHTKRITKST